MRSTRLLLVAALVAVPAIVAACSDDDDTTPYNYDAGNPADTGTGSDTSSPVDASDASDGGGIQRGPITLDFDPTGNGDPISLVWSTSKNKLYIADNENNQIWTYDDTNGLVKAFKLLDDPVADDAGRTNLGQIVELSTGLVVVPRFGFGAVGTILYVDPATGDAGAIPGLDETRKRTALAAGATDQLWGGYFASSSDDHLGVVTKDDLVNGETDFATGFDKPVGVLVQGTNLLVSDQTQGAIFSLPLDGTAPAGGPYTVFANVPFTDALTAGPGDSVITGQFKPTEDGGALHVRQAFSDGGLINLDAGVSKPQGVAYDKTNKRLFIADSNGTTVRTIKIIPLE